MTVRSVKHEQKLNAKLCDMLLMIKAVVDANVMLYVSKTSSKYEQHLRYAWPSIEKMLEMTTEEWRTQPVVYLWVSQANSEFMYVGETRRLLDENYRGTEAHRDARTENEMHRDQS